MQQCKKLPMTREPVDERRMPVDVVIVLINALNAKVRMESAHYDITMTLCITFQGWLFACALHSGSHLGEARALVENARTQVAQKG